MGSSPEKLSRLSHRNLRVTTRIWLIIALFVSLILITHFVLPGHSSSSTQPTYSNANLKAKNYLQPSETKDPLPNPFDFCPAYGPRDEVGHKYGAVRLGQSRQHLGSGARVQRVLNRALAGYPMVVSVIGGSISACHGSGDDPISPKCYPSRFFQWWNTVFPHPASELTNGAMRRTDSRYFGFCSAHHMPDHTDLVIVELDTDDASDNASMEHFETLVRSLLTRPDEPAVILLGHFSPQLYQAHGYVGPDNWHNIVARFYDVPHLSTKSILLPDYIRDPSSISKHFVDPVLASPSGHEILSDVLITYLQSQICTAWNVANGQAFDSVPLLTPETITGDSAHLFGGIGQRKGVPGSSEDIEPGLPDRSETKERNKPIPDNILNAIQEFHLLQVPKARISTRPGTGRAFEEVKPFCVSANNLINPLPPSLFYGSGWYAHHPPTSGGQNLHTTEHYWYSTVPTSKIRIPLQVGAGDIGIYYLKEPISQIGEGSEISCWVDDNLPGAKTIENAANIGEARPALEMIDHGVTRGSHFVECQLMGEEGQTVPMFKIMGVFTT